VWAEEKGSEDLYFPVEQSETDLMWCETKGARGNTTRIKLNKLSIFEKLIFLMLF